MIEVRNLTKKYGNNTVVKSISFSIEKGKIYGFLGPNGAGKTTTMNMITGCLAATSGEVLIDGHDIFDDPYAAKKLIGYLPEQPPLYTDMTPFEYLSFVAEAKGVPDSERAAQIAEVMVETQITDMRDRLMRNLSKGYRQRVGIAQAMLGHPEIIILDEPTVGLDPRQIIEIRDLILSLGESRTVILSSHILAEVSAICDHVMIISKGRLVASDTLENICSKYADSNLLRMKTVAGFDTINRILSSIDSVNSFEVTELAGEGERYSITAEIQAGEDIREKVFFDFAAAGCPIIEMTTSALSLEDVFIKLTAETDYTDGDEDTAESKARLRIGSANVSLDSALADEDEDDESDAENDDENGEDEEEEDDGSYVPLFSRRNQSDDQDTADGEDEDK